MTEIPEAALDAAAEAIRSYGFTMPPITTCVAGADRAMARHVLAAAAPHLAAAERERIAQQFRADLEWLGLTEAHRAAEARLSLDVSLGTAGPNVVALRKAR